MKVLSIGLRYTWVFAVLITPRTFVETFDEHALRLIAPTLNAAECCSRYHGENS